MSEKTFKAWSPSGSSAVMDFNAVLSQTLVGLSIFLSSPVFYQPPSNHNIYLSPCTVSFIVKRSAWWQAGVQSVAALSLYCLCKQEIICNQ